MTITTKENISNVFTTYNPWWKTGNILTAFFANTYKRFAFYEAIKKLNSTAIRRIVFLTGNRRV